MTELKHFMVVHNDPDISWTKVEESWMKLANVESAIWVKTYFNKKKGVRYCLWSASDKIKLITLFDELHISWDSILEVDETVPDIWGKKWKEHLAEEAKSDTLAF